MAPSDNPTVRFYRVIEQARPPQPADRSAGGTLPTRAYRYCEAVTSASAFGWWIFPPADVLLLWDGQDIHWQFDEEIGWLPLQPSAQFPGLVPAFDRAAPPSLQGSSPPFLTALPEPGTLQIWTGLMARTQQDWSLLIRAPANIPGPGGYSLYEGIVETDRWFGPLFTNLRFTRTGTPIRLRADFPLVQVQPLPRGAYARVTNPHPVLDLEQMTAEDWDAYRGSVVTPNAEPERPFGSYAVASRKRTSACPYARCA